MFSKIISFKDKEAPCKSCNERSVSCHSVCERYKTWKQEHDLKLTEVNRKRRADMTYKMYVSEYVAKRRARRRS